jgi:hypothetical protein
VEILCFFAIVVEIVPLNHYFFYPFPAYLQPFLGVASIGLSFGLLGLGTETLDHGQELGDEASYSARVV